MAKKIVNKNKEEISKLLELSFYFANNKDIKYQLNNIKSEIESDKDNSAIYFINKGDDFMLEAETQQNNKDFIVSNLKYDLSKNNFEKSIEKYNEIKNKFHLVFRKILIPENNNSNYITINDNNIFNSNFRYWKTILIIVIITNFLIIMRFIYKLIIYKINNYKPNIVKFQI
ncbi:MAG: hypothetical protein Q8764_02545 [Pigeon pea little leaf phytoplasma]|uniref:Uncharacterized protein n=1 Tax=Candidatus Phytoplasma fabacearum TaxID=2982628 RepID=A0ABU8ZT50_9MOLU|nr:hypothetical protein ['Bituminaria bituminosa' little leaf phytoplasma]MDV3148892.1 hypothetical protein [Pigeon pea little leaf phytoplasma]MDO7983814.1 hypothetical protein ['Bituminaria bituminosa' little leaf phytoplasma]MDO8024134.1 hypothetical protein ['Bituminaria bituminosa' little leaf phytoplasma]MDO8030835.1 hypothetical protein ['Bituminaria bituminosa' little leaf phytoplasma]MDV3154307.1 hypothetical protein [Pigeon pea little leaf phytoplasma]